MGTSHLLLIWEPYGEVMPSCYWKDEGYLNLAYAGIQTRRSAENWCSSSLDMVSNGMIHCLMMKIWSSDFGIISQHGGVSPTARWSSERWTYYANIWRSINSRDGKAGSRVQLSPVSDVDEEAKFVQEVCSNDRCLDICDDKNRAKCSA